MAPLVSSRGGDGGIDPPAAGWAASERTTPHSQLNIYAHPPASLYLYSLARDSKRIYCTACSRSETVGKVPTSLRAALVCARHDYSHPAHSRHQTRRNINFGPFRIKKLKYQISLQSKKNVPLL